MVNLLNIKVSNLCKSYKKSGRKFDVVKDFSHDFNEGHLIVLKGDSGKGKTTLLTLLALLQNEDSGEIYFDNKQVNNLSNEAKCNIRRDEIGIIFQDYNLLNGLTVIENVILADVAMKKLKRSDAEKKAMKYISLLGLEHRVNHYPFELSGGEQQRVGVVRAIFKEPSILFCDEPVSNLDDENSEKIVAFLNSYSHKENKLVIVSNHGKCFDEYADEIIEM